MTVKKVGKNFILEICLKLLLEEAIDCDQLFVLKYVFDTLKYIFFMYMCMVMYIDRYINMWRCVYINIFICDFFRLLEYVLISNCYTFT